MRLAPPDSEGENYQQSFQDYLFNTPRKYFRLPPKWTFIYSFILSFHDPNRTGKAREKVT